MASAGEQEEVEEDDDEEDEDDDDDDDDDEEEVEEAGGVDRPKPSRPSWLRPKPRPCNVFHCDQNWWAGDGEAIGMDSASGSGSDSGGNWPRCCWLLLYMCI